MNDPLKLMKWLTIVTVGASSVFGFMALYELLVVGPTPRAAQTLYCFAMPVWMALLVGTFGKNFGVDGMIARYAALFTWVYVFNSYRAWLLGE